MRKRCEVARPGHYEGTKGKSAPDWALKLLAKECTRSSCILFWTVARSRYRKTYVSGVATWGKRVYRYEEGARVMNWCITINAGAETTIECQKGVLLHEIAHINVGLNHDHDKVWQREVVRLYKKHGLLEEVLTHWCYAGERKAVEKALARRRAKNQEAA